MGIPGGEAFGFVVVALCLLADQTVIISFLGPWLLLIDRFVPSLIPWAAAKRAARAEDHWFGLFILGVSFVARTIARKIGLSFLANLLICWAEINCRDWDNDTLFFNASF